MYTDILRSIEGIEIYPVLSLVLFVVVFGAVLACAWKADRARLDRYAALPFDDGRATPETERTIRRQP